MVIDRDLAVADSRYRQVRRRGPPEPDLQPYAARGSFRIGVTEPLHDSTCPPFDLTPFIERVVEIDAAEGILRREYEAQPRIPIRKATPFRGDGFKTRPGIGICAAGVSTA